MIAPAPEPDRSVRPVPAKGRALVLFVVLTLVFTYPLWVRPHRTLLAYNPDDQYFMWALSWNAHAFVHQPLDIFDAPIFHPLRRTLAYSENLIGLSLFAAPVIWLTGNPVLALNVVALLSCVLGGFGAYVLAWRLGLSVPAALLCGLVFAFDPARFFRTPQLHVGAVQWIPFTLAALHAYLDGGRRRDLRLAAGLFSLQALSTGHGAVFLLLAVVTVLAYRLALGEPVAPVRRLRDLGVTGAALLVPAILVFLPYRAVQAEMDFRRGLGSWQLAPESWFASPTHLHRWLRPLVTDVDVIARANAFLFVGYLPILLAIVALVWGRARIPPAAARPRRNWWTRVAVLVEVAAVLASGVALVVSLWGPIVLRPGGILLLRARSASRAWAIAVLVISMRLVLAWLAPLHVRARAAHRLQRVAAWARTCRRDPVVLYGLLLLVCLGLMAAPPLPVSLWPLVYDWPGLSLVRVPSRFAVLAVLALGVLVGVAVDRLTTRRGAPFRRHVAALFGVALAIEFAAMPLRVDSHQVDPPAADRWLAEQPKPFVVAEVPLYVPDPRYQTAYMLHGTTHWQKTVHGYSGFLPTLHAALYDELRRFPDEQSLERLEALGVTHVVVHQAWFRPDHWPDVERALRSFGDRLKLEYRDADSRVYSLPRSQSHSR